MYSITIQKTDFMIEVFDFISYIIKDGFFIFERPFNAQTLFRIEDIQRVDIVEIIAPPLPIEIS